MKEVITQQATTEVMTLGSDTAKKVVFLGMTTPELIALGAGIIVGGAICYWGYKKLIKSSKKPANMFEENKKLKSFRELILKQEKIATLDSANLLDWFDENHSDYENAKLMIAVPTDKVLHAIGYKIDESNKDLKNSIIQSIYDSKKGTVYKYRFVTYESIESDLQAKLLENEGLVILDY